MIKNNYRVCVAFGDGKPLSTEVSAKSGIEAIDKAKSLHPGARTVHILGLSDTPPSDVEHPLFDDPVSVSTAKADPASYVKQRQIEMCLKLRAEGKSHKAIAGSLGVGKTTVGSWLKQYG